MSSDCGEAKLINRLPFTGRQRRGRVGRVAAVTDDLVQLLARLGTDGALQTSFRANPGTAIQHFDLTGHERDAVISRDLDDFVALGVVNSISELPAVLRGESEPRPLYGGSWFARQLEALRQALLRLRRPILRSPNVPIPRPLPPRPDPPRPDPRPGPDPPGPDV
jgi:hypothetical protein